MELAETCFNCKFREECSDENKVFLFTHTCWRYEENPKKRYYNKEME